MFTEILKNGFGIHGSLSKSLTGLMYAADVV